MVPVEVPVVEMPDLPDEDGIPLESNWHRADISLLIETYKQHRGDATDYYAGGNMFIYYSTRRVRNKDYRGPDFFIVLNVDGGHDRKSWIVWEEEGRYPNVIIELMSATTAETDRTTKKDLYAETFRTENYFHYDPETEELTGYHLENGHYVPLQPNAEKRLWCAAVGLWLGTWRGEYQGHEHLWLRFFDADGNLVPTAAEAAQLRMQQEHQRAENAQYELAQMRERLRAMGIDPDTLQPLQPPQP
ncbi:MAG: Uma2 family endonuclease [Caldilinea sp. CFX5]|nr:Uma2 family endonuclease [Caldilinea sp. CFX5]